MALETDILTPEWDALGEAFLNYFEGNKMAVIRMHYVDGTHTDIPVHLFFRVFEECPEIEQFTIAQCKGKVLDIGAGSGCHSLFLQENEIDVTAIDISERCAEVMRKRGLKKVLCGDIMDHSGGPYDTLLMLMNGIGFVGTLDGLDNFFHHAGSLLSPDGQILLDSSDLQGNDLETVYGDNYFGETTLEIEFNGKKSGILQWLYIDPDTLCKHAKNCGWNPEIIFQGEENRYLARLVR